jgi:hypothetical protein
MSWRKPSLWTERYSERVGGGQTDTACGLECSARHRVGCEECWRPGYRRRCIERRAIDENSGRVSEYRVSGRWCHNTRAGYSAAGATPSAPGTSAAPGTLGGFNNGQDLNRRQWLGDGAAGATRWRVQGPSGFRQRQSGCCLRCVAGWRIAIIRIYEHANAYDYIKKLESESAANDAATALVKQQQQNLAVPKAVASAMPVTG